MSETYILRLLSPLGLYPNSNITYRGAHFILEKDIAFIATQIAISSDHGLSYEHHSEFELLKLEEIRFLGSIMLSLNPANGWLYTYPLPHHIELVTEGGQSEIDFLVKARNFTEEVSSGISYSHDSRGVEMPPRLGGQEYELQSTPIDLKIFAAIMDKTALEDHLLLRGLHALVKAMMLLQHRAFGDAATAMLHVAMETSLRLTQRLLKSKGVQKPTALDAGEFVDHVFNNQASSGRHYFEDYYDDRVKAVHPINRFGTFPYPPLAADDFYDLRYDLAAIYVFLITGHKWDDLYE